MGENADVKLRWQLPRPDRRVRESDLASATRWRVHQPLDDVKNSLDRPIVGPEPFFQFFNPDRRERESDLASATRWRVHHPLDNLKNSLDRPIVGPEPFFQFFNP